LASGKSIAGTAVNQGSVFISDGMNIVLSFGKKPFYRVTIWWFYISIGIYNQIGLASMPLIRVIWEKE